MIEVFQYLSSMVGLAGTILIFRYGIPQQSDTGGKGFICLEEEDEEEKQKIKRCKWLGAVGLMLIALSYILNIITTAFS
jgi:hypothetical protein